MYTYIQILTYITYYIHIFIHTYMHTYIHSFMQAYIYSFIHTYIHNIHTLMLFNLDFAASFCRRMLPPLLSCLMMPPLLSCFCRLCSPLCCCLYSPHFGCLWSSCNYLCSSCIVVAASARLVLQHTLASLCRLRLSLSSIAAATATLDKTFIGMHKKYTHICNIYMYTHMQ